MIATIMFDFNEIVCTRFNLPTLIKSRDIVLLVLLALLKRTL